MHIVLVEPEIPGNTGNIARLCAATGAELHLVRPLGFSVDDRHLKRAGLDYWHLLKIHYHDSVEEVLAAYPGKAFYLNTTKARQSYAQVRYQFGDLLLFGKETAGLPEKLLNQYPDRCIRIPMIGDARSLNLSNAVAVVVYEALRQLGFPTLT
ncbi:MAG: tRNA (uridine(34)/cytosine(34)/5-carboxymethylaminomethyluridine(34)-2'-O)-methyltransferase TrmL [Negativicutes bacterium]|nr:tRNA (uridine(34)/cytosine(34)/5-carboxymethylaminomethyluridine(34)-2'-O)-methyltransferase TrmL [Negativicutes bacterium]